MTRATTILEMFYRAPDGFVRADELARRLGLPPASVTAEMAALEKAGYAIEFHPHRGYRLSATPDRLTADDIRARLQTQVIGSEILVFEQTGSTNDVVEHLATASGREGLVVFAESQTRGRGRHGRAWSSPRGKGLWFSVLLRPKLPAAAVTRITVAASVAIAQALRTAARVDARIRWPNDVTVAGRKLAGILTELRGETDEISLAVLGIGIDVNCAAADYPPEVRPLATSLQMETGQVQDRVALAAQVLNALDGCYRRALTEFDGVISEWAQLCTTLGKQLTVLVGPRRIEGFAQALDADGALLLRKDSGQIERIVGGDIVVERS